MSQSLANVMIHLVFSTKNRLPYMAKLTDPQRTSLHAYIGGIILQAHGESIAIGSVADHIHILLGLPRTISIADLVKMIKTSSTKWIREIVPDNDSFCWQTGYGVFSVSPGHRDIVVQYIESQKEHHQNVSFQDEYRQILRKYDIVYDERYVWD